MHKVTLVYWMRNEILKQEGLIVDHTTTEEVTNFRVDEQGLNYDLIVTSKIIPVQTPKFINVNFTISKSGFEPNSDI